MQKYNLDWKMKALFWFMKRGTSIAKMDLSQVRAGADAKLPDFLFKRFPQVATENRSIQGRQGTIPVRIYRPGSSSNLPLIVFYHGGGFVLGGLESHDPICRRIAAENKAMVVAVAYRLAPANKFPAAVEDAYDATCWAAEHATELGADPQKLIVMGDSAGGNLAAVVSLLARDASTPRIAFQVLIYPVVDMGGDTPSKERYADNPVLSHQAMGFFQDQYLDSSADLADPRVSPLLTSDLSRLPPALILTAEYDPLRDEGQAYADKLRAAGNKVVSVCYSGMPHGFFSFGKMASQSEPAYAQIRQALLTKQLTTG